MIQLRHPSNVEHLSELSQELIIFKTFHSQTKQSLSGHNDNPGNIQKLQLTPEHFS